MSHAIKDSRSSCLKSGRRAMRNDAIQDITAAPAAPYRSRLPLNPVIEIAASVINDLYLDMPELSLTTSQALRLVDLPPALCDAALQLLVETGALTRTPSGAFVRPF
jgi:hypothetical protein